MFTCGRLVDKATEENDLPAPGAVLAESVQLCRKDAQNITRIITKTIDKLQKPSVQIRLKGLRYLLHLAQNGPPAFSNELKLYSTQISQCMSWRGQPHPTRGWEPYSEMKDTAQSLLDLVFSSQAAPAAAVSFSQMSNATAGGVNRSAGISYMESYGSGAYYQQSASLEPRMLGGQQSVGDKMLNFVKDIIPNSIVDKITGGKQQPQQSVYGAYGSTGYQPGVVTTAPQYRPPPAQGYGTYNNYNAGENLGSDAGYPSQSYKFNPPPQRGQFDKLQQDVSWARPGIDAPQAKAKKVADTPAAKLMKISGNRANATNGELTAFRNSLTADSIEELIEGLGNSDWKVRVRAIAGLEICGEQFGFGAVAQVKEDVAKLTKAPQASLKNAANKFYAKIKDVEPTGLPEEPSAFDFGNEETTNEATANDEVIDFGAADDAEQQPQQQEEPAQQEQQQEQHNEQEAQQAQEEQHAEEEKPAEGENAAQE